jgi:IgA Peptidase M64
MFKTLSIFLFTITLLTSNLSVSYGAGNNTDGAYPNYVDNSVTFDIKLLKPLDPSLNSDLTKNRINVVFTFDKQVEILKQKTFQMFSYTASDYYLFKTEPYKSNKDAFNFWYVDKELTIEDAYSVEKSLSVQGVKFLSIVMVLDGTKENLTKDNFEVERSNADFPKIEYNEDKSKISYYKPGNSRFYYSLNGLGIEAVYLDSSVFKHEISHSILDLADEYKEKDRIQPRFKYPNCAETEAEAKLWWGDLIGKVDPEFYTFREERIQSLVQNANYEVINNEVFRPEYTFNEITQTETKTMKLISKDEILNEADYKVTLTNNVGCFAESGLSYRPTNVSLMNDSYKDPLLGYVNTTVGARILTQFNKATAPLTEVVIDSRLDFDGRAASNAICKVILKEGKHILDCTYKYQKTTTSDKIKIGYDMVESKPGDYVNINTDSIKNPCIIQKNFTEIYCTGIVLENYDPEKYYSIGLITDASALLINPTEKEILFSRQSYLTALNDHSREDFVFKLSELVTAEELKPIVINNPSIITKPILINNPEPNIIANTVTVVPVATVRTGGNYNQTRILILIVLLSILILNHKQYSKVFR